MRSLWLEEALGPDDGEAPPLEGGVRADVCVVGGGFTGLWTALRIKELDPSADVTIVEADVCGGGASGRNGGFVLSWWAKFVTLEKLCGTEEALRLAAASAEAVQSIGAFCSEHGIAASFRHDGWLWTATSEAQRGAWLPTLEALARAGVTPFVELSPDEIARRAGPAHLEGVYEATAATVQPALLARGLRRVALDHGVRIHERTPMTSLERSSHPVVFTPRGAVRAGAVVIALNAWAARLRELRRRMVVIASDMIATMPDERVRALGWNGTCISDSRMLVHYFHATPDGRLAFGKGGGTLAFGGRVGASFEGASPRAEDVASSLRHLYPNLADLIVDTSWTGPIDRSTTGLPFFAQLDGRAPVFCGAGYSGNGVGPSFLGGRILGSLALDRDDEWSRCGIVGLAAGAFPIEPARYVGGRVVRSAVARKEAAEDAGRTPRRFDALLSGLAPAGLVPTNETKAH